MNTNNNRKPSGGAPKFNLNWFYALILVILGILYITNQDGGVKKSITYTEFQTYVEKGYVNKIVAYNDNSLDVYIKPEFAPEVLSALLSFVKYPAISKIQDMPACVSAATPSVLW